MTAELPHLMVAPNGARRTKADHAALPITPPEIVDTALACRKAGATGIHIHVRDKDGAHSLDCGLYRETLAAIAEAAPGFFLQVTSEAAGRYTAPEQQAMVRELRPASVSVALREMIPDPAEIQAARDFYGWALAENVAIQHIVYTPEELRWFLECIDNGTIPGRHHQMQFVLGSYTGSALPRPADLDGFTDLLGANTDLTFDWMLCAFGSSETACLTEAARRGGKMRVGFENSLWNADGSLARDNAQRVAEVIAATRP